MHASRPGILIPMAIAAVTVTACVTPNSPMVTKALQTISAGHTGCLPEDNQISNLNAAADGSGTWNATCKGKAYLCSSFLGVGSSASYSCAPVAQ